MILVDTTIWVDHLRARDPDLVALLEADEVVMHAMVIAEIMLGSVRERFELRIELEGLNALPTVTTAEVMSLIERRQLYSRGIGFVDTALLASCLLVPGTRLWTRDRRLAAVAEDIGIAA